MKKTTANTWTEKEFKAYLFLFCALADHIEVKEERDHILSRVNRTEFFAVHAEIEEDTDAQSLKKIKNYLANSSFSVTQKKHLIAEVMSLFMADGKFHRLEKGLFKTLQKILNTVP